MVRNAFGCAAVVSVLLVGPVAPGLAQAEGPPLAARDGQVVLPYAEQKFRGAVGTTFKDSVRRRFPRPSPPPRAGPTFW